MSPPIFSSKEAFTSAVTRRIFSFSAESMLRSFMLTHAKLGTDRVGKNVYANFGFIALDTCKITLGDRILFGPNVHL